MTIECHVFLVMVGGGGVAAGNENTGDKKSEGEEDTIHGNALGLG